MEIKRYAFPSSRTVLVVGSTFEEMTRYCQLSYPSAIFVNDISDLHDISTWVENDCIVLDFLGAYDWFCNNYLLLREKNISAVVTNPFYSVNKELFNNVQIIY